MVTVRGVVTGLFTLSNGGIMYRIAVGEDSFRVLHNKRIANEGDPVEISYKPRYASSRDEPGIVRILGGYYELRKLPPTTA